MREQRVQYAPRVERAFPRRPPAEELEPPELAAVLVDEDDRTKDSAASGWRCSQATSRSTSVREVDVVRVEDARRVRRARARSRRSRCRRSRGSRAGAPTRMRSPYDAMISGVSSVEPSSMTITSRAGTSAPRIESRLSRSCPPFRTGTTIVTSGGVIDARWTSIACACTDASRAWSTSATVRTDLQSSPVNGHDAPPHRATPRSVLIIRT